MRHVLLPGAPATGPYRMGQAPAAARLVASTGGTLGVISGLLRTAAGTIDLTAVAATANKHLGPTTDTQEQPGRRLHRRRLAHAWTTIAMLGIMPRHACSARCGARRRSGTWRFRSAPCLPIRQVSPRIVRSIHLVTSAAHADLWICGQRKRVAHIPTGSKNVTAQVVWLSHARRRDLAKLAGSRFRASMMFQRCFLAVETKERMSAKSIAPCNDRNPPEIFCRSFIMRPSRSA